MLDFKGAKKYIINRLETELKPNLYYHGIHHTMDVYEVSIKIAEIENIAQEEKILINTAALFHDAGFIFQYEHNEIIAVKMIREILPKFGYNDGQIKTIGDIILTTRVKARPITLLQKIMSDSDYDYLGRNDVGKIATTLYKELAAYGYDFSEKEWNEMQIKFLKKHEYHTSSSLALRRPKKLAYYDYLKSLK